MKRREALEGATTSSGTDGRSASLVLPPALERSLRELATQVNDQVRALDDGSGAVLRRLVALLLDESKQQASERLALRARKFVEQKGRCAACELHFDARRRPITPRPNAPLVCSACDRAARLRGPASSRDDVAPRSHRPSSLPPSSLGSPAAGSDGEAGSLGHQGSIP